jgi:cell division protein FtsX
VKRWLSIGALVLATVATGCASGGGSHDGAAGDTLPPPRTLGATAVTPEDERDAELVCRYIDTLPRRDRGAGQVWMKPSATDPQVAAVRATLGADPAVSELDFTDQIAARAKFVTLFPDVSNARSLDPELLPASFAFVLPLVDGKVSEPASFARIRALPGVDRVMANGPTACGDVDPATISAARQAQQNRFGDHDFRVFLHPAQPDAVARVRDQLLDLPGVVGVDFVSQDESLAEFRCLFWADAGMIRDMRDPAALPPSFRVDAGADPDEIARLRTEIGHFPGVKEIISPPTKAELYVGRLFGGDTKDDPRQQADCPLHGERIR